MRSNNRLQRTALSAAAEAQRYMAGKHASMFQLCCLIVEMKSS
jgi:hypothetical protein